MTDAAERERLAQWCEAIAEVFGDGRPSSIDATYDPVLAARYRAIAALLRAPNWRTIDSAPKDGTFVNLYCPRDDSIWHASWQTDGWYGIDEEGLTRDSAGHNEAITKWRPLTGPPHD